MIRKSISLVALSMLFSSCVSMAPKLEVNSDEVVAKSFKNYQIAEDNSNISLNSFLIIKIALLRVEESKSLYRIEESNLYPKIDANGSFSRDKKEEIIKNNYKASVGTVFELDLFGKNRSLNDAAKNSFLATQYALSSTKLSLISQTINSYLSLATNIENLNLQKKIYENLSSVYELTQKKFTAGVIGKEDVLSSFAMLKESQNEIISYENQIQIDINSLEFIALTANTGYSSSSLNNLFSTPNSFWQISPSINLPIFTAGENSAKLDLSETQKEIALNEYQKGIQTAFKEVNDALMVRKNIYTKLQNQKELTASIEDAYNIALNSYKIGYGSYLNMLIAQKAYINSQKTLTQTYLEELENRVEIFKTLGGEIE